MIMVLCLLAIIMVGCSASPARVAIGNSVRPDPSYDFNVQVQVTNIVNLNAANYDVYFNSALVSVGNVTDGNVSGTDVPIGAWTVVSPGDLRIINAMPGLTGASGSGYLAQIGFNILFSGNVTLSLGNGTLSNTSAVRITAKWLGATFASTVVQLIVQ